MSVRPWKKAMKGMETSRYDGMHTKIELLVEQLDEGVFVESVRMEGEEDYTEVGTSATMKEAKAHLESEASRINREVNDKRVKARGRAKKQSAKKRTRKAGADGNVDVLAETGFSEILQEGEPRKKRHNRKCSRKPRPKNKHGERQGDEEQGQGE